MARIAFILLCHKNPAAIVQQAQQLTSVGDYVAIHFDASSPAADYTAIQDALADNPNVAFAAPRIKCGWGAWSLVQATLHTISVALNAFPRASHFYLVSGDCMAIKSAVFAHAVLDAKDCDYIESHDFFESNWIKTGFKEERLIYRHFFNERSQTRLFYTSLAVQRKLHLTRDVPSDLQMMIGSQWWCLRRATLEKIFDFLAGRRDVVRFFKTTWIPDETFFQTLVRHLVPGQEIANKTLTFLMFSDYGQPVTFHNDQFDLLVERDALFARKISSDAHRLRDRLGQLYACDRMDFPVSDQGRNIFQYVTGKGRRGRRFAPRFWETGGTVGRDRDLLVILCKKWHVAKRLVQHIQERTDIPAVTYLFNEAKSGLPDLGGIEKTVDKRLRHRRAFLRMVFSAFGQDRLVICLDPADIDLLHDLMVDQPAIRLLEIVCKFDDDYLLAHAGRIGLVGENSNAATVAPLLPMIRSDLMDERDRLRDASFANVFVMQEGGSLAENAAALARFLCLSDDIALALAQTPDLFND
ncbi:DUF5928 domain-containing protein [Yoonia sp.]|uniref:DUF5928 domain-containing protein n=1 Tax=Yoonia sp. TaxID=2212373 RepID=UPI0019F8725A|nr:DUF5928 domain-containing protein [Yoonia sp.]MBE0412156.1 glycosyl transferase [Yoonia sp.]